MSHPVRNSRAVIGVTSMALAATCLLASTTVSAGAARTPDSPAAGIAGTDSDQGRGPSTEKTVAPLSKAQIVTRAAETAVAGDPIDMPSSYPYQPDLKVYRDNADDAAHTAELIGHPEIAPKLLDLMESSDRISTQVVGQSSEGRDLYLVTVTAPETVEETAQQEAWKTKIKTDPVAAAADTKLLSDYKTPVWISNNIHGNEWEGTDAAMQYIEFLATAPIAQVRSILANNRLYFSPSLNPDGRTNATRATALGLDPNRDMITNSTPETKSFIRQAQAIQPIYAADFHGYTGVLQMEPTGPPHGSNYEYDLYIPHNYALALKVEKDVIAKQIPGNPFYDPATDDATTVNTGFIKIPYRDTPDGWDDFPPIFTAQYTAFYGAASATVELPKSRASNGRQTPANAVINTAVARETMESLVEYMNVAGNAKDMLKNQIETFRRGVAGERKTSLTMDDVSSVPGPTQWRPLWDVKDDQEPVTLPRAYVIPVGDGQRSSSDAARLVEQLLLHDIEVGTLASDTTVDGKEYPKGSFVVDMHQPLRGLVNSLFDLGDDISGKFASMYDVSAWSYSHTWGATVDKVGLTTDQPIGQLEAITSVPSDASAPAKAGYTTFEVDGVTDFKALNALLDEGVEAALLDDGTVVVAPDGFDEVVDISKELDLAFDRATAEELDALDDPSTKGLKDLKIAYTGAQDDKLSLTELGFDELVQISAATINSNPAILTDVDLIWASSALSFNANTQVAGREALAGYFARGGSIVGTSGTVTTANTFGLITGTATSGPSNANGIADVDTAAGSFLQQYAADTSFVYRPYWFTGLGENVTVEQSYDGEKPLLAGHWRESSNAMGVPLQNGPEHAAGKAAAVSATAESGSKVYAFGTTPFWRNFPKGLMSQAARAIFWAAPAGSAVVAPGGSSVTIAPVKAVTYPGSATVSITAADAQGDALDGTVELRVGSKVVATATTTGGRVSVKVPGLKPGTTSVTAYFTPTSPRYTPSVSAPVSIAVAKATSTLKLSAKKVKDAKKAKVTVNLRIPGIASQETVRIYDLGKKVRTMTVTAGKSRTVTLSLKKGTHRLQAVYAGSSAAKSSKSKTVKITIK